MSSIGQGSISIDESTRIGQNAQDTANEVAGNVNDINSDNKLTPTEKLKLKQEYDKDVELYNIDIEQLKSVDLPTAELETAMSNLAGFVTPLFKEMNRTSTVDRDTLDSVFTAFATADKNSSQAFVNMVQQVADDAKKAGDDAKEAGEKAQEAGETAKQAASQAQTDATQAKSDAATAQQKAQSSIDQLNEASTKFDSQITDAKKNAQQALDNIKAVDSKVDELSTTTQKKVQDSIDQLNAATTKFDGEITDAKNSAQQALNNITVVDSKVTKLSDSTTAQFNTLNNGYQEVISTVNNIDIGGTNLIKNSSNDVIIDDTVNKQGWAHIAIYSELEAGQEYTFTSPVTVNTGKADNICVNNFNPNTGATTLISNCPVVNGKIEYTFTAVKDFPQLLIYAGTMGGTKGNKVTFKYYKLEKGNKATDWSPAPEDLASQTQITTLNNLIDQKVSNNQYQSDKTQTAKDIASKVSNNDFSTYKTQTADAISQKVATKDFSAYQATTANAISSKVESSDFNTYKTQTDSAISSKVESSDFNTYVSQTADAISSKVESKDFKSYQTQTADLIASKVANSDFSSYKTQTAQLIGSKVDNGDYQSYKTQTANLISQTVTNAVNNIDVGGRNYLLATGEPFTKVLDETNNDLFDYSYYYSFGTFKGSSFKTGMKVMWSYDWEVSNMTAYGHFNVFIESSPFTVDKAIGTDSEKGLHVIPSATNTSGHVEIYATLNGDIQNNTSTRFKYGVLRPFKGTLTFKNMQFVVGNKATDWSPAPEDLASKTDITATIGNIHLGVKNADGSTSTFNMNGNTILMDTAQTIINGKTSILDASIDTAKIANAAINTAQIADGAINNAKIAYAAIDDAKISNLNGNKLIENSITANKINVDDLIANGINAKTLTAVNLNTSTLTTPQLNLGLNGTFTEDFDYTQDTSWFLPKMNKGTLTFNHGVLQSKGTMQTYTGGQWGGMNDQLTFQSGISNAQWTEVAPGYIKMDLYKQNGTDIAQRTYSDPTGFYYTSATGDKSYLGNILQTSQVQTPSLIGKYIGASAGVNLLQIGSNGDDYGLQVGSYAGNQAVLSDFIYNSTTSGAANVNITGNGHLVRSTSASKYKYNIKNPDIETTLGDRLLNVHLATWNDKRAVDMYAEQLSTGEEREKSSIDKYYGLIAEQLRDAGLDMFISYGKNHEIEGIQYDRAWIPLLSVIRRLNDKVNEYELRLSKLEGTNK